MMINLNTLLIFIAIISIIILTVYLVLTLQRFNAFLDEAKEIVQRLNKTTERVDAITEKALPFLMTGLTVFEGLRKSLEGYFSTKTKSKNVSKIKK